MIVGPLSARDAFGGRWAWNLRGWAIMLLPGALVVAVHETSLVHVSPGRLVLVILISTVVQSVAAGLVSALIATIARRRWPIIPLALVTVMWLGIGVVRGVSGGVVAEALTGEQPFFLPRMVAWTIISLIWMPLVVYVAAQIEHRRDLLAQLASLRNEADRDAALLRVSAAELRSSLATVVRDRIRPIIDEIHHALMSAGNRSDVTSLRALSDRLSAVWLDSVVILDAAPQLADGQRDELAPRPARSSISAALAIELVRPLRAALLSGAIIVPAIIPVTFTASHLEASRDSLLGLIAVVAVLFLSAVLRRRLAALGLVPAVLGYLAAGVSGSLTIAILEMEGINRIELVTLWLLPIATILSASSVTVAVGIGNANAVLADAVVDEKRRVARAHWVSAVLKETVRTQLALLMHGPIQGRLAACVMALNFHLSANEPADPRRTDVVISAVIEHLAAASRDLDDLPSLAPGT